MTRTLPKWALLASGTCAFVALAGGAIAGQHDALVTKHASANGVPESLVRRVIYIESKGNPRVISKGNFGLMQIRLGTARSLGYTGSAEGLLDADTNMTYAVRYLASAYRAAGCIEQRAIAYYQRGFYKKPMSSCGPRAVPAVVQVATKERAPAAEDRAQQLAAAERISAPFDALRPKIVQVQTIVRPKAFNVQAQSVQAPPSAPQPNARPSAPVQSASLQLAAAPAAPAAEPQPIYTPTLPLPRPAQRPEAAPPQTVAKAADVEQAWPPALTPEQPAMVMLPMPKPRPAQAPKVLAKLDVAGRDTTKQDAVASDLAAATEQASSDATQPATSMLPMPKPRPAQAPKRLVNLEVTGQGTATRQDAAASEGGAMPEQARAELSRPAEPPAMQQVAKLDPQAVPLPQRRPAIEEKSEHQGKSARRASHRHVHHGSRQPETETPALVTFFKKLTTPPEPARRQSW
ncbi:transglycosylase SLT domain-containing protein [Rhodoplanes sp. Z2-YC6860]|uniref:transglycosylase SLT domain-containing protein n=1 Tax=Rhodoplanes sp. Z2-YC6860 TaxID=674703 RepID=UPI00078B70C8|nr:soluble lytic murein transglycosylase [Rhodoplanes sp. Z2-YC6860]